MSKHIFLLPALGLGLLLLSLLKSTSIEMINNLSSKLISVVMVDGSESGGSKLSITYGAWVDQRIPLKPSFKQQVADDVYKTGIFQVDLEHKAKKAVTQVNSWVDQKTNGLIKDVLPPGSFSKYTRLISAKCLYFNGKNNKFDPKDIKDDDFHLMNGSTVKAPFITNGNMQLISTFDGFKVLRVPYKQGYDMRQFSMYIFLPDAREGLPSLMERVRSETNFLNNHIPSEKVLTRRFMVPNFKISSGIDAYKILRFSLLAGMTQSPWDEELFLTDIFPKIFIKSSKKGTEAAAVTILLKSGSMPPAELKVVDFVADHPFMFLIRADNSGVAMFVESDSGECGKVKQSGIEGVSELKCVVEKEVGTGDIDDIAGEEAWVNEEYLLRLISLLSYSYTTTKLIIDNS